MSDNGRYHLVTVEILVLSGGPHTTEPDDWEPPYADLQHRGLCLTKAGAAEFVKRELDELYILRNGPDVVKHSIKRVKVVDGNQYPEAKKHQW